ncbi:MAG: exodeoxyribonuclease VII small subunit [Spartobacteria bacterium]|nr:exodeoxyribonuclease VII small subunit [Spartobacteria bacterium]
MTTNNPQTEASFEEALHRLESIVSEMERGELTLETMANRYEEGVKLVDICEKKLNAVQKKIEKLVEKDDGTLDTTPF